MKAISFTLNGKMAHFRKYYSNSTALSYMLPPVTTIKGIVAGILGYERDSYYEKFSAEKCKVSIIVERPIKKMTQTMNLLKVEALRELNGAGLNRTQNNMEFIIPKNIRTDQVSYRIVFYHEEEPIMNELQRLLCQEEIYLSKGINVSLGSMQCQGWISDGKVCSLEELTTMEEDILLWGTMPREAVAEIDPKKNTVIDILKEETITEFDAQRIITAHSKKDILANLLPLPLCVRLNSGLPYYRLEDKNIILI